jgi:hypothetical protein
MKLRGQIRPGDVVEVKSPREIIQTLDADGALDHVPFMPEMIESCGRRFRVSKQVVTTCCTGASPRAFRGDGVFTLDGLRCSGAAHDGCQKACMIFWREPWLRKVDEAVMGSESQPEDSERLRARLKTSTGPRTFYCQASELLKASDFLSRWERVDACVREVRVGNCSVAQMAQRIGIFVFWRIRRLLLGPYPRGKSKSTPGERLNLRPGERVEVKPIQRIVETLNEAGNNRGLRFSPDMRVLCGEPQEVMGRIDKIIVDGTGEMRQLHDTVRLKGSVCGCAHLTFGGCSRNEILYWREIWLCRSRSA